MEMILVAYLALTIVGGVVAIRKKDYFTRGAAITFFTNIFGVVAMLLSPNSKARENDEFDSTYWPKYGPHALGLTLASAVLWWLF